MNEHRKREMQRHQPNKRRRQEKEKKLKNQLFQKKNDWQFSSRKKPRPSKLRVMNSTNKENLKKP